MKRVIFALLATSALFVCLSAPFDTAAQDGKRGLTFEVYRDRAMEFRWRLKAGNGQVIASSQGYSAKADCMHSIEVIKMGAADAKIVEEEPAKK